MNTRGRHVLKIIEIGFLALCGTAGAASVAGAQPAPAPMPKVIAHEPALNYVLLLDDHRVSMSGDTDDLDHVRNLRHGKEPLLWFHDGGAEYVVRDPATVQQVVTLWRPVSELGDQQGKLGDQQGRLGDRQGKLGAQQGELGAQEGELAQREVALDMKDRDGATDAQRAETDRQRQDLRRQQRAIEQQMHALGDQMNALGREMNALGGQMNELGRRMNVAERKAEADLRALIRRTIASGLAQRVS